MMPIIYDSTTVVRAQISIDVLREYLKADDANFEAQAAALSSRGGVVVCYKNRVRIKRMPGCWYQISGYREDGNDLQLAVFSLRNAERMVERRQAKTVSPTCLAAALA